jgi:hypothetical protein
MHNESKILLNIPVKQMVIGLLPDHHVDRQIIDEHMLREKRYVIVVCQMLVIVWRVV